MQRSGRILYPQKEPDALIKALADEGLLDSDKDKNVKSVSVCGKKGSIKLLCIDKEKADQIIALSE